MGRYMDRKCTKRCQRGVWVALSFVIFSLLVGCQRSSGINRIPAVAFVQPVEVTVPFGDPVVLEVRAEDSDGSVTLVTLAVDGEPLTTLTHAPYIVEWHPVAPGTYTVVARAVDNLGAASLPATLTIIVTAAPATLNVVVTGEGIVTSTPEGMNCVSACSGAFETGSDITLRAVPEPGFALDSWQGCEAEGHSCTLIIQEDTTVQTNFVAGVTLTTQIVLEDGATGYISLDGERCEPTCAVPAGRSVTLTAVAGEDSSFAGWEEVCRDALGNTCELVLEQDSVVSASFDYTPGQVPLSVTLRGQGKGQVVSEPAGISCPND
jgi:hypothetical protein